MPSPCGPGVVPVGALEQSKAPQPAFSALFLALELLRSLTASGCDPMMEIWSWARLEWRYQ